MAYRQREPAAQLRALAEEVGACRACPRLVEWREQIGREKRKAYDSKRGDEEPEARMDEFTHIIQNVVYARDPKIFDTKNGYVNQRNAF